VIRPDALAMMLVRRRRQGAPGEDELVRLMRGVAIDANDPRIPSMARHLAMDAALHRMGETAERGRVGIVQARKSLQLVTSHSGDLIAALAELGTEARSLLDKALMLQGGPTTVELIAHLDRVRSAVSSAPLPPPASRYRPHPQKTRALTAAPAITKYAARLYTELSGRPPRRQERSDSSYKGAFVTFLAGVFGAVGVKANAAWYARKHLEAMEAARTSESDPP